MRTFCKQKQSLKSSIFLIVKKQKLTKVWQRWSDILKVLHVTQKWQKDFSRFFQGLISSTWKGKEARTDDSFLSISTVNENEQVERSLQTNILDANIVVAIKLCHLQININKLLFQFTTLELCWLDILHRVVRILSRKLR